MSNGVIFADEERGETVGNLRIVQGPPKGISAWLVKRGVTHSAKQAENILLIVAIIAIILAVGIYMFSYRKHPVRRIFVAPSASGVLMPVQTP